MPSAPRRATRRMTGGIALAWAVALALATSAGACRTDPETSLRGRAQQFLELKQKRDWAAIYDSILDPETRKTVTREAFLSKRKVVIEVLGFTVVSADVQDGKGAVRAKVDAMIPLLSPRGGTTMIRKELVEPQQWVRREGQWYIELEG